MCEVCKHKGDLIAQLSPFLKEGVSVDIVEHEEWETLTLRLNGHTLKITADGDEGGYFHHETPDAG